MKLRDYCIGCLDFLTTFNVSDKDPDYCFVCCCHDCIKEEARMLQDSQTKDEKGEPFDD